MNLSEEEIIKQAEGFLERRKPTVFSKEQEVEQEIEALRYCIDLYDKNILYNLQKRMNVVDDIQKLKDKIDKPTVDADREIDILEYLSDSIDSEYLGLVHELYSVIFKFVKDKYE